MPRTLPTSTDASGLRFGIAAGRFNEFVVKALVEGAVETLASSGADPDTIDIAWVPGAVELPVACKAMAKTGRYDAVLAIGCVIRGGTPHFDYVCSMAASGLGRVALDTQVPVTFGVLTVESIEQAIARSGTKMGNKGREAALAAVETARALRAIGRVD